MNGLNPDISQTIRYLPKDRVTREGIDRCREGFNSAVPYTRTLESKGVQTARPGTVLRGLGSLIQFGQNNGQETDLIGKLSSNKLAEFYKTNKILPLSRAELDDRDLLPTPGMGNLFVALEIDRRCQTIASSPYLSSEARRDNPLGSLARSITRIDLHFQHARSIVNRIQLDPPLNVREFNNSNDVYTLANEVASSDGNRQVYNGFMLRVKQIKEGNFRSSNSPDIITGEELFIDKPFRVALGFAVAHNEAMRRETMWYSAGLGILRSDFYKEYQSLFDIDPITGLPYYNGRKQPQQDLPKLPKIYQS